MSATGVIRVAPTGSKASPNVRYAFNSDQNLCVATNRRQVPCVDGSELARAFFIG